jgi:Lambda phage tail tube protein, TTP
VAQSWTAINTFIYINDTSQSPSVWTKVAQCDDISGPKIKRTTIDVTTHDALDSYVQYLPSLKDGQQVTMTAVWDPTDVSHNEAGFASMKTALEDGITRQWKIVYPTSPLQKMIFSGFVVGYEPDAKAKDALRVTFTVQVTDKATLEAGS